MFDTPKYAFKINPKPALRVNHKTIFTQSTKAKAARAYAAYKKELALRAKIIGYTLPENGILIIKFTMPIPIRGGEVRIGLPHTQKPDIDNLVKAFMDSIAIGSDEFIHTIHACKVWGEFGGIEVFEGEKYSNPANDGLWEMDETQ